MPPLRRAELDPDPIAQFGSWWELALDQVPLPDAMMLASADADGAPDARMVLLKGFDDRGFRFFTNYESAKAGQLEANPRAALVIYWRELDRQVRVRGTVSRLEPSESDDYFETRARDRRIGAWASPQSAAIPDRDELERRVAEIEARFADRKVSRPDHWGGYLLRPQAVELWQGSLHRLHDRFRYRREATGWILERLAP